MNLRDQIGTVSILNIDNDESTISSKQLILINEDELNGESYILSECDEELLILIEFKEIVDLHWIKLYAFPTHTDEGFDKSPPKHIHIYKVINVNINFDDIQSMRPNKTVLCSTKKLAKGQHINLKNKIKFRKTRNLAIFVQSNQNDTEITYLNGISLHGKTDKYGRSKMNFYKPIKSEMNQEIVFDKTDTVNVEKLHEFIQQCDQQNDFAVNMIDSTHLLNQFAKTGEQHQSDNKQKLDNVSNKCNLNNCIHFYQLINTMKKYNEFIQSNIALDQDTMQNIAIYQQHIYNNAQPMMAMDKIKNVDYVYNDETGITSILNHFHHLLDVHPNEFEEIHKSMVQHSNNGEICQLADCHIFKRHHKERSDLFRDIATLKHVYCNSNNSNDISSQQILDTIHCHYYHSFDIGYKLSEKDKQIIQGMVDDSKENVDDIYIKDKLAAAVYSFVATRKYKGNINYNVSQFCTNYGSVEPFDFVFFYWDYYKHNVGICDPVHSTDIAANTGYRLCDFYVAQKYNNLKDELINNQIYRSSLNEWKAVYQKAFYYLNTTHFKRKTSWFDAKIYYNINKYSTLSIRHVIAILIHCNDNLMRRKLGETYRALWLGETSQSIIKRHRNFANLGRLLREFVHCFCGQALYRQNRYLYHGIGDQTFFSSTNILINGPFSTTTSYPVVVSVTGNKGLILEIRKPLFTMFQHYDTRNTFDCRFISDSPNEQEIFSIGATRLSVRSVIVPSLGQNFCLYIEALSFIKNYLNVLWNTGIFIGVKHEIIVQQTGFRMVLDALSLHYPNNKLYMKFLSMPSYIRSLQHNFFSNITRIMLMHHGQYYSMLDCLFYYDYGWIKLDLITTLFPSLSDVSIYLENDKILRQNSNSIFSSILSIIERKPQSKLQNITISSKAFSDDILKWPQKYIYILKKLNWIIYLTKSKNVTEMCLTNGSSLEIGRKTGNIEDISSFGRKASNTSIPAQEIETRSSQTVLSEISNILDDQIKTIGISTNNEYAMFADSIFTEDAAEGSIKCSGVNNGNSSKPKGSNKSGTNNSEQTGYTDNQNNDNNTNNTGNSSSSGSGGDDQDKKDDDKNNDKKYNNNEEENEEEQTENDEEEEKDDNKENDDNEEKKEQKTSNNANNQYNEKVHSGLQNSKPFISSCTESECINTANIALQQSQLIQTLQEQNQNLMTHNQYLLFHVQQLQRKIIELNECKISSNNTEVRQNPYVQKKKKKRKSKKSKKTNMNIIEDPNKPSYNPSLLIRARGNIQIDRQLTTEIIPRKIKENIENVFKYMDKSTALQIDEKEMHCNDKKTYVLNYDFHEKSTGIMLYCVMKRQDESSKTSRGYKWKMENKLFTAKELHCIEPLSTRMSKRFVLQLDDEFKYNKISVLLLNGEKSGEILNRTKWHKINVFGASKTNQRRMTLSMEKEEFVKIYTEFVKQNVAKNMNLIPILMFGNNEYWIEYLRIIRIDTSDIGISLKYHPKLNTITVTGIHLNRNDMFEQHQLVLPTHDCHCFDGFISNITNINILGDLKQYDNACMQYEQFIGAFVNTPITDPSLIQMATTTFVNNGANIPYNQYPRYPSPSVSFTANNNIIQCASSPLVTDTNMNNNITPPSHSFSNSITGSSSLVANNYNHSLFIYPEIQQQNIYYQNNIASSISYPNNWNSTTSGALYDHSCSNDSQQMY